MADLAVCAARAARVGKPLELPAADLEATADAFNLIGFKTRTKGH